jgi:hypothetical protein
MNDADVLMAIRRLVDREHPPRARNERSDTDPAGEHGELSAVEEQLDQRWDLLGERPARHRRRAGPSSTAAFRISSCGTRSTQTSFSTRSCERQSRRGN